jgi:hypothetical protein
MLAIINTAASGGKCAMARNETVMKLQTDDKETFTLLKSVNTDKPTPEALKEFRALMAKKPKEWGEFGDVMRTSCEMLIKAHKAPAVVDEPIRFRCEQLRADLSKEGDGPLERLQIEHVVLCWLRLGLLEQAYGAAMNREMSLPCALYWEKRMTMVQKRYLRACESLARTRKLMRPPKSKLSVGTINALLSGKYTDDTLSAVLRRKPDNPDS